MILGGMIYPTADLTKHKYQDENSSSHAPLPETSTAALVAETKQQTSAGKTRSEHNAGVSESTSKADCLSGVSPGGADRSDNVDRKRVFFQRPGSSNYDSFFTIAKENKKSGEQQWQVSSIPKDASRIQWGRHDCFSWFIISLITSDSLLNSYNPSQIRFIAV